MLKDLRISFQFIKGQFFCFEVKTTYLFYFLQMEKTKKC